MRNNPFIHADNVARQRIAEISPFYGTVVSKPSSTTLTVTPIGQTSTVTVDASPDFVTSASVADIIVCMPLSGAIFALANRSLSGSASSAPRWISATDFVDSTAVPNYGPTGTGGMPRWAFDAATPEGVSASIWVPVTGLSWTPTIYFSPPNTNSGNIVFQLKVAVIEPDSQVDQTAEVSLSATVAAPGVTDQITTTTFAQQSLELSGYPVRIEVLRDASNGSDNYSTDIYFLGLGIEWA